MADLKTGKDIVIFVTRSVVFVVLQGRGTTCLLDRFTPSLLMAFPQEASLA